MTAILEPNHFTAYQYSQGAVTDKLKSTSCDQARAARERFLAQHGPGADLPQRQVTSKELRKALRAAEMARWECFHTVPATAYGLAEGQTRPPLQ